MSSRLIPSVTVFALSAFLVSGAPPRIVHDDTGETFPFSGYVDPRLESSDGATLDLGQTRVSITFDQPVRAIGGGPLTSDAFVVRETGGGVPPTIVSIDASGNPTIVLTLSRVPTLQEWTTVQARVENLDGEVIVDACDLGEALEDDRIDFAFLPADVDQNRIVLPADLLRFREIILGTLVPSPGPTEAYVDIDRNNRVSPFDLLRFRQLVLGVPPATRPWGGESLFNDPPESIECGEAVQCARCLTTGTRELFTLYPSHPDYPDCVAAGGSSIDDLPDDSYCYAWDEEPDEDPSDPEGCCDPCGNSGTSGYPVHLFSGEKTESVVDLSIPGRGFDFVLRRTYRSRAEVSTLQGHNWDMSYNIRLERVGDKLVYHSGDLRRDDFTLQPDGTYHRGEYFRVVVDNGEAGVVMRFGNGETWAFKSLDDPVAPGRITERRDRNANAMTFEYDNAGRLTLIGDTLNDAGQNNRTVGFAYDAAGRLTSVTDFMGRQVRYDYYEDGDAGGSAGDLKSVTYPAVVGTSTGNDFPDGKTWTYEYTTGFSDERLNHNLTSITDAKGQVYKVLSYGTDPSAGDYDRVTRQVLGGDIIDYTFVERSPLVENRFATRLTIVNDRMGNVSHHYFDAGHRAVRTRQYTGRADPTLPTTETENRPDFAHRLRQSDPEYFETVLTPDVNSQATYGRSPNGDATVKAINGADADPRARGNVTMIEQKRSPGDPDQTPIVEHYEYLDGFGSGGCCGGGSDFVTSHVDGRGNQTHHEYDLDSGDRIRTDHRTVTLGVLGGGTQEIVEQFEYNAHGQLTRYVNPTGRADTYAYYDSGPSLGYLQSETVDAQGFALQTVYEYDAVGNVTRTVDPRGSDTLYEVNALNQVVRSSSRPVEVTKGGAIRYERDTYYDANDNVVRRDIQNVDDGGDEQPNSHFTTVLEYDILNDVVRTCSENGSCTGAIPGPTELPTCDGLPESEFITTEYEYDRNKNRTLVRYGEAVEGRQPANTVRSIYDERDLLFRVVRAEDDAGHSTTQNDYDRNGNRIRAVTGLEDVPRVRTYAYDGLNRLRTETDPEGNVTRYAYDDNHNVALMRVEGERVDGESGPNVLLSETVYEYDEMDRTIVERRAFFDAAGDDVDDGESTMRTFYDLASQVIRVENDNGHGTDTAYDSANRLGVSTDARGNTLTLEYDANSNVVGSTERAKSDLGDPDELFATTYAYDALDRLTTHVDNVGNTSTNAYDSRDNRVRTVDAPGNVVRYEYDGINRLTLTGRTLTDDGTGGGDPVGEIVTTQTWDDSSRLTGQSDDNGHTTAYVYDALNRMTTEAFADDTVHAYTYDVHDNVRTALDANGTLADNRYDLLDRLVRRDVAPAPGVSNDTTFEVYKYDGLSRLVYAEDDDALVTREYDSLSNVSGETLNGRTTVSQYDGVGNQVSCLYPGGRLIECAYDELERKSVVTDGATGLMAAYDYVGADRVERRDYGNGTRYQPVYDGITGIPNEPDDFGVKMIVGTTHTRIAGGEVIDDRTYAWDAMYNKKRRSDVRPTGPQLTHDYTYDSIYRLTRTVVTDPVPTVLRDEQYDLDGVGNRNEVTGGGHPGLYTMDPTLPEPGDFQLNQYTTTPPDARMYDLNGNLVRIDDGPPGPPDQRDMVYDYRNRMVQHTDVDTVTVTRYGYDALGRRIAKIVNAAGTPQTTRYFYDGGWQVLEEQDESGATQATYVYGLYIDEVLNMRRGGADFFYHSDDLYNVVAVTDAAGAVVERYEYQDYGAATVFNAAGAPLPGSAIDNPCLFTGRRLDPETDFYHYRTRYLDPAAGRFTTRDVIGIWGDSTSMGNGQMYAGSHPTTSIDPFGYAEAPPPRRRQSYTECRAKAGSVACQRSKRFCPSTCGPPIRKAGFNVGGQKVDPNGVARDSIDRYNRSIANKSGILHVDILYNSKEVRQGFGGGNRMMPKVDKHEYKLKSVDYKKSGVLKWGTAKGMDCKCAWDADIIDCLQSKPKGKQADYNALINSCQTDVEDALLGCCLRGYKGLARNAARKTAVPAATWSLGPAWGAAAWLYDVIAE